jgi:hypothetical protein
VALHPLLITPAKVKNPTTGLTFLPAVDEVARVSTKD